MTVYNLFREQVIKNPESVAIVFGDQKLSYSQLDSEVNQLASYLKSSGIKSGDLVGVSINRSAEMVVTLLSLIKIGATYLPLDPSFPAGRLRFIVEDSKCTYIVTEKSLNDIYDYCSEKIINIEDYKTHTSNVEDNITVDEKSVVYVLYTSGSTGNPKGVQITHKSLVNFLTSMQLTPGLSSEDSLLAITTLSFDISGLEIFLPLVTGAKLVIAAKEETLDGKLLLELLKKDITVMQATPATWKLLLESDWHEKLKIKALCGGEALSRDLANEILVRVSSLWNMYGPTETTIWSSCAKIEWGEGIVPIGKPISKTQFYIVDKNNQFCAPGVQGELLIGGEGLSIGYLNRDELTKEKFIPNPFDKEKKSFVYRTGDLVRLTPKREIEFLGRADNQVKIRGYRIETGEIESALRKSNYVKDAAVVVKESENHDKKLVAYCVPESQKILTNSNGLRAEYTSNIKNLLKDNLPDYMVPPFFVYMESLPLTPNGKIDRKELERLNTIEIHKAKALIKPKDLLEEKLVQIWQKLLCLKEISTDDNFFELGGHSILAAQMFAELEKETGKKIPLATLFKHQTISEIADTIHSDEWRENWSPLVLIKEGDEKAPLFLIHGAEGNVLLYRDLAGHLDDAQPVYGLQSRGLNGSDYAPESIEEMAYDYIEAIKKVQPEGPYNLGGYCLGGTIAFEIAQQLMVKGEEIKNLFLIETYNECVSLFTNSFGDRTKEKIENLRFHFENLKSLNGSDKKIFLKHKAEIATRRTFARINSLSSKMGFKTNEDPETSAATRTLRELNDSAQTKYIPESYKGKTILLKPKVSFSCEPDENFGWKDFIQGEFKVYNLDLAPRGMLMEPFVEETAAIISKEMNS